jgi:hypothetical protein
MDVVVTGDPFHSLHATATVAEEAGIRRSVGQVPEWTVRMFAAILREPLLLAVPVGVAFAWRHRRTQAALPLAAAAAMTAVFAAGPIFGLPLIARYIRTPAVLLTLFAGLALTGWMLLPPGRERRGWMIAALVTAAGFLAFLPSNVTRLQNLRQRSTLQGRFYGDLRRLGESPNVRRAFAACAPLSVSDHKPVPFIRYWLDGDPGSVQSIERRPGHPSRLLLLPRHTKVPTRFYQGKVPTLRPPPGYREVYRNRSWDLYAAPGCGSA